MKASGAIAGAAIVLLGGSLIILSGSILMLTNAIESYHIAHEPFPGILDARSIVFTIIPVSFSLLGFVTGIGLFWLREWARKLAIFMSVAPVTTCGALLSFRPAAVFPSNASSQYAILAPGPFGDVIYAYTFAVLIPLSVWWLILFSRESVRRRFS